MLGGVWLGWCRIVEWLLASDPADAGDESPDSGVVAARILTAMRRQRFLNDAQDLADSKVWTDAHVYLWDIELKAGSE